MSKTFYCVECKKKTLHIRDGETSPKESEWLENALAKVAAPVYSKSRTKWVQYHCSECGAVIHVCEVI